MGLEQLSINGETFTFFNIAEEMSFLRDQIFEFLTSYSWGILAVVGVVWFAIFFMVVLIAFKKILARSTG